MAFNERQGLHVPVSPDFIENQHITVGGITMNTTWSPLLFPFFIVLMLVFLGGCGKNPHTVSISSEPPGALVFLNNKIIGETPFDTRVQQRRGDYNIYVFRAVKDDFLPMKKTYKEQRYHETADDVVPKEIHFILQQREKHELYITSEPNGAVVTLNGEIIGETPFVAILKERIGNARVFEFIAIKDGYQPVERVLREFLPQENGATFEFPETLHFDLLEQEDKKDE